MSQRNQAAWWSPIAEHNGDLYLSYLAPNSPQDDVFVAKRTAAGLWQTQDTGVDSRYDVGHTQTSLGIDGAGRINVLYGMHGGPKRIVRSNASEDITAGFTIPATEMGDVFDGGQYTYPNITTAPNGDMYMIVRDRQSSSADQNGRLFRFGTDNQWAELPPFAGQAGTTVYPDHVVADPSGDLHIIWEWASGGPNGARHYGSYTRYEPDTQTYFKADGTAYPSGPISLSAADVFQGLEGNETFSRNVHGFQSAKMMLDEQNRPMIAYSYSLDNTSSGYEHRFARWDGTQWSASTVTQGPFDIDKPWIGYSDGVLRYYGTVSPNDPLHTGRDDIFLRTSDDFGATWSTPQQVTSGIDVQRPVGVTADGVDYLYLPDINQQILYFGKVSGPFDGPIDPPVPSTTKTLCLHHGISPDASFEYQHILIRNDTGLADTPQPNTSMLVGTKANTSEEPDAQGELRSLLQFDLTPLVDSIGSSDILEITLRLQLLSRNGSPRIDGSPKIDLYAYDGPFSESQSTWNDPDGDGSLISGDQSPGGTLGDYLGTLGELNAQTSAFSQTFATSPAFVAAVENALSTNNILRLMLVEDNPDLATRDIAFFRGMTTSSSDINLPLLSIVISQLAGDYNADGVVDALDYAVWREALGTQTQLPNEDATPGEVTAEDYNVWRANYGATLATSTEALQVAVPEPASIGLAVFAIAVIGRAMQRTLSRTSKGVVCRNETYLLRV